jgi:membrane fusion protein, heavy metal efflux system
VSIQAQEPPNKRAQEKDAEKTQRSPLSPESSSQQNKGPFLSTARNQWIIVAAVALIFISLIIVLLSRRSAKEETAAAPAPANSTGNVKFLMEQQWLIKMKLAKAEKKTIARQVTSTGRVVPAANSRAIISPPVGGIIASGQIPRVGQFVQRGQTLAVIHQTPTASEKAQIAAGNAQLRVENARIEAERRRLGQSANEAQARLNQTRNEYERAQRLYEKKAYSKRQLEAAEADYKAAEATYAAAVEQNKALGGSSARLGEIVIQTSYVVKAPISGTVVKVSKAMGEQVEPGEEIVEIINMATVWVEAPIFERDLFRLGRRSSAIFTTPAYAGVEYNGKIIDIGSVIDEQSRAATITFEVTNPGSALRIGMQANVRLDAGESVEAMVIPKEAVLEHEGKKIVYVLLSGEEFQRREVTLGDEYGDTVAVLSGLQPGERVVTQGAYQLKLQELRPADAGAHTHET